jgi:predicted hotdog family 3-hydroxylacyl-ACP dehydratase
MKNIDYMDMSALLPHKHPMIFIDGVSEYDLDKRTVIAYFTVTAESHFYDPVYGGVPSWVGIEYMAQSIGTLAGIIAAENGEKPSVAFLLGTKSYEANTDFFKFGKRYNVCISENFTNSEMGSYNCLIYDNDFLCASANMNAYLPENIDKVLNNL